MAIGYKLREARKARGWSTAELAARLGSHREIVSRVELGHHMPSVDTLYWYVHVLEVPVEQIAAPANILQRWI